MAADICLHRDPASEVTPYSLVEIFQPCSRTRRLCPKHNRQQIFPKYFWISFRLHDDDIRSSYGPENVTYYDI